MLPIDIMRVTASASARVLARAIDDGRDADQVAALLAIVSGEVESLAAIPRNLIDSDQTNVVSIEDYRRQQTGF